MKKPLIVLTGPTAAGKTHLSIALAKAVNGEIISADSMQVYKYMDIGSAKIRPEEMQGVPHHLVDCLEPDEEFNVVRFQQMAKEAIEAAGMTSQDFTVSSSNEIQTVVQSMVGKVDAIYAPTDNTIAAGMTTVGMVAGDNKLPVICGESGMVENGGLATYGIDYYQLGYMTGQQAVRILTEGASPADMPIEYLPAEKCELTVNEETASTLGIDVSNLK